MKKICLGLAAATFGAMLTFSGGAQAAPAAAPTGVDVTTINFLAEVRHRRWHRPRGYRGRRVIRHYGPRCRVVVTKRVNRRGVLVTRRVRRCR